MSSLKSGLEVASFAWETQMEDMMNWPTLDSHPSKSGQSHSSKDGMANHRVRRVMDDGTVGLECVDQRDG